ncbi:putative l-aminoadipate-semialdehyde dehydrogenase protein [Neofusicoccum parvum]|uniref:L-aminoadipate-semialdehyde dehydrogenase protein n=1 Tax=Neofusicoccum parvum TaxID=310453 RepID=A0ACB5SDY1_9PEZI|nr:putative l-aminoadipate-semialdehyde dehydrogenase protein [Neofusicoccum parvum]
MGSLPNHEEPCVTLDQVIRRRADTHADRVLISYPANESDFVDYTGRDLERLTRLAATKYAEAFADLALSGPASTVAIVGISSLEYYIAFLALQRLGLTSMFISPRLADQGFEHLLRTTHCNVVVASGPALESMARVRKSSGLPLATVPMLDMAFLSDPASLKQAHLTLPPVDDGELQGFIIHSGGTTGLPKPVPLRSKAWLLQAANIAGRMPRVDTLSTLPLFHSFGLATLLRCLVNGKRLSILNAARPITASAILTGLDTTASQALVTVPYILKFITEAAGGTARLGALAQVIAAGSAIPDELGDRLVAAGAHLFHLYGQTESGALMEPSRDQWNWVTPLPDAAPFLAFEPVGADGLFQLVVLPGLRAKVLADRPDGSYATKDLFRRHPDDPSKWKFVARMDDIVVLLNGEKADPIPLEDAVTANPNVRAAVVFGAQRDSLGMVVVAADGAAGLSRDEVVASILPDLELGNSRVPAYARIPPDAVIVKEAGTQFPCTDKATVIRSLFIKQFESDIEDYYNAREMARDAETSLSDAEVRDLVRHTVRHELRLEQDTTALTDASDFFVLGMDSLQATNVRSKLLRSVNLAGRSLATNVVFDHPSVELLTTHLLDVRQGVANEQDSAEKLAMELLEKYSHFPEPAPSTVTPEKQCVLLTGATGAIGTHILHTLLLSPTITTIYCPVRASSPTTAHARILSSLHHANLHPPLSPTTHLPKISAHPCDLSSPTLGLPPTTLALIRATTTHVIHNAWPVNFNHALRSFEPHALRSTYALLALAASSPLRPKPRTTFISSIAAALRAAPAHAVPETLVPWAAVEPMGYAQSKWVAEGICGAAAAAPGARVRVVRVGQCRRRCGRR